MAGIAFKLSNQDFTDSPLGSVTFRQSDAEIAADYVAAYSEAIGTTSYNSALTTMMTAIVANGLDTKISALYPMLGDTLAKQSVNLIDPTLYPVSYGANASVVNNTLTFVNTIGVGECAVPEIPLTNGYSCFICCARNSSVNVNTSYVLGHYRSGPTGTGRRVSLHTTYGTGVPFAYQYVTGTEISATIASTSPNIIYFRVDKTTSQIKYNSDAVQDLSFSSETIFVPNTLLGQDWTSVTSTTEGGTISANNGLFDGYVYFYAIGDLTMAENAILKTAAATFLSDVKSITIS